VERALGDRVERHGFRHGSAGQPASRGR
jgi:hypothetical protein